MAKGKDVTGEQLPAEQPLAEATPLEAAPETLPPDATQEALLEKAREEGKADAFKTYQGMQRTLDQRDKRIRELEATQTPASGTDDAILELLLEDKRTRASELQEVDPTIPKLEALLAKKRQDATFRTQQANLAYTKQVYEGEVGKLRQKITDAGGDPEDEAFETIFLNADVAYFKVNSAEEFTNEMGKVGSKLDRVLAKTGKTKEPEETDEEKTRKYLEAKGLLVSDTGLPSGAGGRPADKAEAAKLYAEGKLTDKQYSEWRYK